jgi:signal transduction histidine kinase
MKLQSKLVLYNAISKALILSAIAVIVPMLIQKILYNHLDKRLDVRHQKLMRMIRIGGLNEITLDQDCSFDSQNIFKEEFVSISPLATLPEDIDRTSIGNVERMVDREVVRHRVLTGAFIYDNQIYKIEIGEGLSSAESLGTSIRNFILKLMLVVVLLSIFFDLGFAQFLLKPFNRIVNDKLKGFRYPTGNPPAAVRTNTYEFAYLDRSINEMMGRVQEAFQKEREFITNVSHELLTPISILQNRVENMINDPQLPDETVNKLADTQKTLSRLSRVVKALLYISRIENEQYIRNEQVELDRLMKDVLDEVEVLIQDKDIKLEARDIAPYTFRPANLSLIHTLVFNLVSNAIKYNRPGGTITVRGREQAGEYILSVSDSGIGIPREQLPHIFDRFKRMHPETEMGYGLGLPIVQSIAAFHGIGIDVASTEGEGTTFSLSFRNTLG